MAHKAEEGMHLCVHLGWCTFCDHLQVQITGLHTFLGDPMCQIGDLLFEKTTFWWLKFQIIFSKLVKDHLQLVEMLICYLQEYNYVIQVDEAINEIQFTKQFYISLWNVAGALHSPKRHAIAFKEPQIANSKGVILFRCPLHF